MITTMSYIIGADGVIKAGCLYYFGELYDGCNEHEILESGCVAMLDNGIEEERIVDFSTIELDKEDLLNSLVKVTRIR